MPDSKIIAVVGATGAQGGGLARAILAAPHAGFSVRAITRDPTTPAARALADAGAEVVAADISDEASMTAALQGAYGAFLVTFFWAHLSPEREKADARTMAHAAKAAGVQHVIWSTLEDTRDFIPLDDPRMPTLLEHYKVPHLDAKGESNAVFTALGLPTTFLYTSFYWDNLISFGMGPVPGPDGVLTFTLPMGEHRLSGIAAEDIGRCAFSIFRGGAEFIGRSVGVAGEHLTGREMAAKMGAALQREVRYNAIAPSVYSTFGFPGADDAANMFQFFCECEQAFVARRAVDATRLLNPGLQSFDGWLEENAHRIPLA